MTTPFDRIEADGYPLDYDWAATHDRDQDYCLLGRLRGDDVVAAAEAVHGLLRACEQYDATVDGQPCVAAVDGGLRARAVSAEGGVDVELYSTGEDAAKRFRSSRPELPTQSATCPAKDGSPGRHCQPTVVTITLNLSLLTESGWLGPGPLKRT
ncbi:MAG TPA: hypothetical protein PKK40_03430 [Marmoricola sp.]|nr:hypothetical protein [Marmoricola sp.]